MMANKAFERSKIEYGKLVYWGAAEGYLEKLDRVQSSAVSMLENSSAFFIPSLESRRQAAAVGLSFKLLGGQGRGALSEVQPGASVCSSYDQVHKILRQTRSTTGGGAAATSPTEGCSNPPQMEHALTDNVQKELQSKNPRDVEQPGP